MPRNRIATACLTALALLAGMGGTATAQQPAKPQTPAEYAALIRPKLSSGWRCLHDDSHVFFIFDDVVTLNNFSGSSAPRGTPPEAFRIRSDFVMTLKFSTRLSVEQFRQLIAEREAAYAAADDGRQMKGGTEEMHRAWQKFNVPNFYNDRHSIRFEAPALKMNGLIYGHVLEAPQAAIDGRELITQLLLDNMTPFEQRP